ncbi:MAG TPA: prepilin-type N-terminal cleavage/methylation domain-containing protein [Gemmatimonadaceae bacterium]|nr:prepilin-type N-terminal cleavage/methylation domain-containing protein [Gemmatimonadaceae bacterium]
MLSNRKGFTLIELLIVVVIIGILAAIAIPKFANTKEKAYVASMKSDLKNMSTAQEAYFADYLKYFSGSASNAGGISTPLVVTTGAVVDTVFAASSGVTVTVSVNADSSGWQAKAEHGATTKTCGLYLNMAAADAGTATAAGAKNEGEPACTT